MCLGIPGKVAEKYLQNDLLMAKVEFSDVRKEVCLVYVPEAELGDYVIVHAGFAISRVDEAEAEEIFRYLEQIGEFQSAESQSPESQSPESQSPESQSVESQSVES